MAIMVMTNDNSSLRMMTTIPLWQTLETHTSPMILPSYLPSLWQQNVPSRIPTILSSIKPTSNETKSTRVLIETKNLQVQYFEVDGWVQLPDYGLASSFYAPYKSEMVETRNYPQINGSFAWILAV